MTEKQEKANLKRIIESTVYGYGVKADTDKLLKEAMNQKIFNRFKSVLTKESK